MIEKNYFDLAMQRVKLCDLSQSHYEMRYEIVKLRIATLVLLVMENYRRNAICLTKLNYDPKRAPSGRVPFNLTNIVNINWLEEDFPEDVLKFIDSIENITLRGAVRQYLMWHFRYKELQPLGYLGLPNVHEPMLYYGKIVDFPVRIEQTGNGRVHNIYFDPPMIKIFSQIETPFILLTEEDFAAKDKEYEALGDKFWDKYLRHYVKVFER